VFATNAATSREEHPVKNVELPVEAVGADEEFVESDPSA
jgi:hypothetical protein